MTVAQDSTVPVKPRLRGVFHQYAFFVSLATGLVLVLSAATSRALVAAAVYAASVSALFGASALYHRPTWSAPVRRWLRRLDHSMIFLVIAGTYTPLGLLVLSGRLAGVVLAVVWGGAVAGIVLKMVWIDAPKWLGALLFLAVGWAGVIGVPQLVDGVGAGGLILLGSGGLLYTLGAVVYVVRRPDPVPAVFGYHEVFHLLVIVAAALQYLGIAFYVLPA